MNDITIVTVYSKVYQDGTTKVGKRLVSGMKLEGESKEDAADRLLTLRDKPACSIKDVYITES